MALTVTRESRTTSGKIAGQSALGSSMSRNRFKSAVLYATAGIGLLLVLVALLFAVEHGRTLAETGAVLSALFSQGVLHNLDSGVQGALPIQVSEKDAPYLNGFNIKVTSEQEDQKSP